MSTHASSDVRVVGLFPSAADAGPAARALARLGFDSVDVDRGDDLEPTVSRIRARSAHAVERLGPVAGPEAAAANFAAIFGVVGFVVGVGLSALSGLGVAGSVAVGLGAASACWLAGLLRASVRLSQRALVAVQTRQVSCVGVAAHGALRRALAHLVLGGEGARFIHDVPLHHSPGRAVPGSDIPRPATGS